MSVSSEGSVLCGESRWRKSPPAHQAGQAQDPLQDPMAGLKLRLEDYHGQQTG